MTSSTVAGQSGSDKVAEFAQSHPSFAALAKTGWVAKGVVYALVGFLAVPIVVNGVYPELPGLDAPGARGHDEAVDLPGRKRLERLALALGVSQGWEAPQVIGVMIGAAAAVLALVLPFAARPAGPQPQPA